MQATQTVSNVASLSKSATLSIPKQIPQPITQTELVLLLSLRGRLSQLEERVAGQEVELKARLEAGCLVEEGDHTAALKERSAAASLGVKSQSVSVIGRGQNRAIGDKHTFKP
jgi:hypothetical protein